MRSQPFLAAMRLTWGVMLTGIVSYCTWLCLEVPVGWLHYRGVVAPVLEGRAFTYPSMGKGEPVSHLVTPSWSLVAVAGLVTLVSVFALGAWNARAVRRSPAFREVRGVGEDYRSTSSDLADPERARRAVARRFVTHAALVAIGALLLVAIAAWRLPPSPFHPGVDQSPYVLVAARRFAAIVEALGLGFIAVLTLVAAFPTDRRARGLAFGITTARRDDGTPGATPGTTT